MVNPDKIYPPLPQDCPERSIIYIPHMLSFLFGDFIISFFAFKFMYSRLCWYSLQHSYVVFAPVIICNPLSSFSAFSRNCDRNSFSRS